MLGDYAWLDSRWISVLRALKAIKLDQEISRVVSFGFWKQTIALKSMRSICMHGQNLDEHIDFVSAELRTIIIKSLKFDMIRH